MAVKKKLSVSKKGIKKPLKKSGKKVVAKIKKKKVLALPKGYHNITPYLIVNSAKKAIDFYKKVFAAKEVMRLDKPDGSIAHAELKMGDSKIMLADECPEMHARSPKAYDGCAVSIHLYVKDVDAIVKGAVKAGAKIVSPIEDRFYGDRAGVLEDPFGHLWCIATHIEDVSPAQIRKRAVELYSKK